MPGTARRGTPVEARTSDGSEAGTVANPFAVNVVAGGAGGGAVTVADGADVAEGAKADAAATTDTGTFSLIALFKRLLQKLTGQFPAALTGSGNLKTAVVETTVTQPVSAASLPLPTGAATEATTATRLSETDFDLKAGSLTETAPATDTASSGLNGRLQRVAQRLTSLIGQLPTALVGGRLDVNVGATGVTQPVSGTVTANAGTGTFAVQATAASPAAVRLSDGAAFYDGAKTGQLPSALVTGRLDVNVGAALPAGNNNIGDVDVATLPNVTLAAGTNTNEVVGDGAHAAAIAGNPVRIGARAASASITAVTDGQTVDVVASLLGKLIVLPLALPANTWSYAGAAGGIVNTTGISVKAAAGAGIRNYITKVSIVNSHATISTEVVLRDGAAGTVLWRGWAQAAGGGQVEEFTPPLRGTANTLVELAEITATATTGVVANVQGFVAAE